MRHDRLLPLLTFAVGLGGGVLLDSYAFRRTPEDSQASQRDAAVAPSLAQEVRGLDATAHSPDARPRLVVKEPVFDFGEAERGSIVEHNFTLRNEGDASLQITGVTAACRCTVAELAQKVIPAGAEILVHAELNLQGLYGPQFRVLQVHTSDPDHPTVALTLKGLATSQISVEPEQIQFGRLDPAERVERVVELKVSDKLSLEIDGVETGGDVVSASLTTITPGKHYQIAVSLEPPLKEGQFYRVVRLKTNGTGEYKTIRIPVIASIMSPGSVARTPTNTTVSDLTEAIKSK